jgi:hypothetical protein
MDNKKIQITFMDKKFIRSFLKKKSLKITFRDDKFKK